MIANPKSISNTRRKKQGPGAGSQESGKDGDVQVKHSGLAQRFRVRLADGFPSAFRPPPLLPRVRDWGLDGAPDD